MKMKKFVAMAMAMAMTGYSAEKNTNADSTATMTFTKAYKVGDVNGDGKINASDASTILSAYAELANKGTCLLIRELADVNGDNKIDSSDASSVLRQYSTASTGATSNHLNAMDAGDIIMLQSDNPKSTLNEGEVYEYLQILIYTEPNGPIFDKKSFLDIGDRFKVVKVEGDWCQIYLTSRIPFFCGMVYIKQDSLQNCLKLVGRTTSPNATETTSAEEIITTTTESTVTTETTTATTTTTNIQTTTTTTTEEPNYETTPTYTNEGNIAYGSVIEFVGTSWILHDKVTDNDNGDFYEPLHYINYGEKIFIKDNPVEDWYCIGLEKSVVENAFICIPESAWSYFNVTGERINVNNGQVVEEAPTPIEENSPVVDEPLVDRYSIGDQLLFVGDFGWNLRASTDFDGANIIGSLQKGDVVKVMYTEIGSDWYFIESDAGNFWIYIEPQFYEAFIRI